MICLSMAWSWLKRAEVILTPPSTSFNVDLVRDQSSSPDAEQLALRRWIGRESRLSPCCHIVTRSSRMKLNARRQRHTFLRNPLICRRSHACKLGRGTLNFRLQSRSRRTRFINIGRIISKLSMRICAGLKSTQQVGKAGAGAGAPLDTSGSE